MGNVFVNVGMSLDGFIAGPNDGPDNPLGDRGPTIHQWAFQQRAFREALHLGKGGETGQDNRIAEATFARIGANIMGKRMFDQGEHSWPEDAPFHTQVFVLTREVRDPWPRPGGTTFHFVNDSIETVLRRARDAAGDKDVRISGGANVIAQYLNAGLVDELQIALAPVIIGGGVRLFDRVDRSKVALKIVEAIHSPAVTHVRYSVR
jgi:dihydrofolate reductase